jgi:uncharacterized protein YbjT (DUF2867 family)
MKIALVIGATGLIGKQLLALLIDSDKYSIVKAVTRKPISSENSKLENIVVDYSKLANYGDQFQADDVFCCLGTTMKQAGSKEAFQRVDFDYPLEIAALTKAKGANKYFLVSALGAGKNSSIYYNRVKGEVEDAIANIGFLAIHIFRPSLLLGPREEKRSGEDAAKIIYKIFNFLIPAKYKAIDSAKVAKAMLHFANDNEQGVFFHESVDLQRFNVQQV